MGDAAHKNAKVSQRFSQFYIVTTVNSDRPHIGGQLHTQCQQMPWGIGTQSATYGL